VVQQLLSVHGCCGWICHSRVGCMCAAERATVLFCTVKESARLMASLAAAATAGGSCAWLGSVRHQVSCVLQRATEVEWLCAA
jgi:hypothetical protein